MDSAEIDRLGRRLEDDRPFIGPLLRKAACMRLVYDGSPGAIARLAEALGSRHEEVRQIADEALRTLLSRHSIDALCDVAIRNPSSHAARIVVQMDYQPESLGQRSLLFLMTGRIDRYLALDSDLGYARAEYESGDEQLRRRISAQIRKLGDSRLLAIVQAGDSVVGFSKSARELTEREADVAVEANAGRTRYSFIFSMLFHIPASSCIKALHVLEKAKWKPEEARERELLKDLLAQKNKIPALPVDDALRPAVGPVIWMWMQDGLRSEIRDLSLEDLARRFRISPPAEAVAALSALASHSAVSARDVEAAQTHEHWPVRIACLALCEFPPDKLLSAAPVSMEGGALWMERMAPGLIDAAVYRCRAADITTEKLRAIRKSIVSSDNKTSAASAVGKLLCTLAEYRLKHQSDVPKDLPVTIDEWDLRFES